VGATTPALHLDVVTALTVVFASKIAGVMTTALETWQASERVVWTLSILIS